jgi:hypothetical protein
MFVYITKPIGRRRWQLKMPKRKTKNKSKNGQQIKPYPKSFT